MLDNSTGLRSRLLTGFRICGLALLFFLFLAYAHADNLDDYIKTQMLWQRIPGLSLAVVKDGKINKAKGYGLANVETNTPASPETVYKIGSVSKQFLAAGMMALVQEGKVGLDDTISRFLEGTPPTWKDITIRQLLTHTSGMVREAPGFDPYKAQTDAEVIQTAYSVPLGFAPGGQWAYSNTGYYCLAEIIHKVSGKPWGTFITERIFTPAGMTATRLTTADIVPHRATGYETRGKLQNADNWLAVRPSGAFLSTVLDFARWDAALYSETPLTASSRAQMWTPVTLNSGATHPYGFGWFVDTLQGHTRVHHSGGVPGFVCEFQRYVDDKLTVIVMANVGNRDLSDLAVQVAAFYLPALTPPALPVLPDTEPGVTTQIRKLLTDFANGKPDLTRFTPELAQGIAADIKSGFADTLKAMGPIQAVALLERKTEGANRTYRHKVSYKHITLFVDSTVDKDNKIARFAVHD